MRDLVIKGHIPNGKRLKVKVDDQEKFLDHVESSVCFTSLKNKVYRVCIMEEKIPKPPEFILWILFVLTMPIQGVIHAFLINNDRKWYKEIFPYYIKKMVLEVDLNQIAELNLEYFSHGFDPVLKKWSRPEILIKPSVKAEVCIGTDITVFKDQYLQFTRKILSVFSVVCLLFGFLWWVASKNSISLASIIVSIILAALVLVTVFLILYNYKIFCRLKDDFVLENEI